MLRHWVPVLLVATILLFLAGGSQRMAGLSRILKTTEISTQINPSPAVQALILTLSPDLTYHKVQVLGITDPEENALTEADLLRWGLQDLRLSPLGNNYPGYFLWGVSAAISLTDAGSDRYFIQIHGVNLEPGVELRIVIPSTTIDWQGITPAPDNLEEPEDAQPEPKAIIFHGGTSGAIQADIPITFIQSDIDLTITPLMGELIANRPIAFRISGQVKFDNIQNYIDFQSYCNPAKYTPFDYRRTHLLRLLDYPSAYFSYTNSVFDLKPTSEQLVVKVISCEYNDTTRQVVASFNGSPQTVAAPGEYPAILQQVDVRELNIPKRLIGVPGDIYEIQMGEFFLAPGDHVKINMAEINMLSISPEPALLEVDSSGQPRIEYTGPARFSLVIDYSVRPTLVLNQFPSILRSITYNVENGFVSSSTLRRYLCWIVIVTIGGLAWLGKRSKKQINFFMKVFVVAIMAAGLYFLVRNVIGWIMLASMLYVFVEYPVWRKIWPGLLMTILSIVGWIGDAWFEKAFSVLGRLDAGLTSLTPIILSVLAVLPIWFILHQALKHPEPDSWNVKRVFPFLLCFFALSAYDEFQKSLPSLILLGLWSLFFIFRYLKSYSPKTSTNAVFRDTPLNILRVIRDRWFWLAFMAFIGIASVQGIGSMLSMEIFRRELGLLAPLLALLTQVLSVTLVFAASCMLFLLLYPLLPFKQAVFKAVFLAVFLLSVFLLGIGSDERLTTVLGQLIISRFIYYLGAPLFAALVLDIKHVQIVTPTKTSEPILETKVETVPEKIGRSELFARLEKLLSLASGIASIVAPALYNSITHQPVITNYFQLMKLLGQF